MFLFSEASAYASFAGTLVLVAFLSPNMIIPAQQQFISDKANYCAHSEVRHHSRGLNPTAATGQDQSQHKPNNIRVSASTRVLGEPRAARGSQGIISNIKKSHPL